MKQEEAGNEISLIELVDKWKNWFAYLRTKWLFILIFVLIGAVTGVTISIFQKKDYVAELTFALEEKGGGANAYAGIASQLGIDLGGEGGAFSGDNSLELIKSRKLIEQTLLTPVMINGEEQLLVNRYRSFNSDCQDWEEDPVLSAIQFKKGEPRSTFSVTKDSLLKVIYRDIKKHNLYVNKVDKKLNIIHVKCRIEDEFFAKYFIEVLVKNASDFYIETKTKRSKYNVLMLEQRVDSVRRELDKEIFGVAISRDQNTNTLRAQGGVQSVKKQMNVQVLTTMYGELVKNLELSKFSLMREEPLFQVIDIPILPLDNEKFGKKKGVIIGGIIGFSIALLYLTYKRIFANTRQSHMNVNVRK